MALGSGPWRTALSMSPAEPGLASALPIAPGLVSAGGWPDLHPVQALRNIGCERVVYVTRRGEDSAFGRGVAKLLGATPRDDAALYDLDDPKSGFSVALSQADGVWCTDWDHVEGAEALGHDGYTAPLLLSGDALVTDSDAAHPYENARPAAGSGLRGCAR
jgi:hypothetical protein